MDGLEALFRQGTNASVQEFSASLKSLDGRVAELNARLDEVEERIKGHRLWVLAAEKVEKGANLTREEAAAYVCVSVKTLQRMEADREIQRCLGLRGVVRYAARDVQRLASARREES